MGEGGTWTYHIPWRGSRHIGLEPSPRSARDLLTAKIGLRIASEWMCHGPVERVDLEHLLQHPCRSAPGPDGIACACWAVAGSLGVEVLWRIVAEFQTCLCLLAWFTFSHMVLLPTGSRPEDAAGGQV